MIPRKIENSLREALDEYPVVTIFGPRQSGKTTLAKSCCPGFGYVNLEEQEESELAAADPKAFFLRHPAPVVLDEIQRVPSLVSQIQVAVDADRARCGRFVLTGSHQTALAEAVDESLAGRTAILELLPLSLDELGDGKRAATDELLFRGFMPELHAARKNPARYYRNYLRTYVERDVRRLVNVRDLILFERFVALLAGRIGQTVNFSSLAGETGVSSATVSSWLSVLEASFLVYRLKPWFSNVSKRFVKSPKIYFAETGLAAHLLGIRTPAQLATHPLRGALFENMCVMDVRKRFLNAGEDAPISFLRTEKGFEIDLLIHEASGIRPVEIKSAMTFNRNLVRNLEAFAREEPAASSPVLLYDGSPIPSFGNRNVSVLNFRDWT
ncbi:MAG: ATP-binding protein [Kiritimatiellae bacterium]|nr:ATP-binding protein [Kiritimatiellia bacterium]